MREALRLEVYVWLQIHLLSIGVGQHHALGWWECVCYYNIDLGYDTNTYYWEFVYLLTVIKGSMC